MTDEKERDDNDFFKNEKLSIGDSLKKLISVGVGAAFLTEDAIKNVLGDIPLSKDIISGLLQQAKKSKEEFLKSMREELSKQLKTVDPKALMQEVLDDYEIHVDAKINFSKKEGSSGSSKSPLGDQNSSEAVNKENEETNE